MKATTAFAIKANIAAMIASFALVLVLGFPLVSYMENIVVSGTIGVVTAFIGMYFALWTMLKNGKLTAADRANALTMTWKIAVGIWVVFSGMQIQDLMAQGIVWISFSVLALAATVGAVFVVKGQR